MVTLAYFKSGTVNIEDVEEVFTTGWSNLSGQADIWDEPYFIGLSQVEAMRFWILSY